VPAATEGCKGKGRHQCSDANLKQVKKMAKAKKGKKESQYKLLGHFDRWISERKNKW
jgi:hypothetical protein